MEELEFINTWKAYDQKLEQSLTLNKKNTEEIIKMKVGSLISTMQPLKLFTIVIGMIWVGFGSVVLSNLIINAFTMVSSFFLISAGLQVILTAIALVIYLYQLVMIHQIDMDRPILEIQEHLAKLKASTLWITRILFLQLPLWTTFYLSKNMLLNGDILLLIIQAAVTSTSTFLAVWLFLNIRYENRDKKWFRMIFEGKEWTPVMKSMQMLEEVSDFRVK